MRRLGAPTRKAIDERVVRNDPMMRPEVIKKRGQEAARLATMLKNFDLAAFTAQSYEVEMVHFLAGIALHDITQPIQTRIDCAEKVLNRARGKPSEKTTVEVYDARATSPDGDGTMGETLEGIAVESRVMRELTRYVMSGTPPADWPEEVRRAAGADVVAEYSGE